MYRLSGFSATSMVLEVGQLQLKILVLLARQLEKPRRNSPPVSPWHSEQTLSAMAIPDRVDVCWGVSSLVPVKSMSVARQKARA